MSALFAMILKMSIGAGVTALFVLLVRALLGRRPGVLMPLLYALLLLRMLLPFSVASPLSMVNLLPRPAAQAVAAFAEVPAEMPAAAIQDIPSSENASGGNAADIQDSDTTSGTSAVPLSLYEIASIVWAAGAAACLLLLAAMNLRFALILHRNRPYTAPTFEALLASCKAELRIRQRITVVRFSGVNAAAVYGALRPRLLICPKQFETLSEAEQRGVLLHELAHIKRGDTAVSLLVMLLGALHWFNPVILLALVLMRRDMEAFCDATVLKTMDEAGRHQYARTLMKLSDSRPMRLYPILSISKTSVKRRIVMVSRYRRNTPVYTALALLLTLLVAAAGCTSAVETQPSTPPAETSTTASPMTTETSGAASAQATFDPASHLLLSTGGTGEQMWQIPLDALDAGGIANIQKAAQLLDGTVIAYEGSVDLMALLGDITESNGWAPASEQNWGAAYNMFLPGFTDEDATTAERPGGGAEIVLAGLANGAGTIGCDIVMQSVGAYIMGGSVTITNTQYDAGLELRAQVRGNMLVIAARDASLPYGKPALFTTMG